MRAKKYPLEPLRRLKKEKAEDKARALAAAVSAREAEERKRLAAEAEREAAQARERRIREGERAALERGELTAGDLALSGAWEQRVAIEDAARGAAVEKARGDEARARTAEARSRSETAHAESEVELIARHERRWTEDVRKAAEAREEEDLAEAVRAPRR